MKAKILKAIQQYERIILHRHIRPDPDAYGSQMGLAEIIRHNFHHKEVYVTGNDEESLLFLGESDVITDDKYKGALVIVCDTANAARIEDQRYTLGDKLIKIDHHPNEEPYGDLVWVDTNASSCSEMIADFCKTCSPELCFNEAAARLLYAGIVGDTGRFLYTNTTEKTMRLVANLFEIPFDKRTIYDHLYSLDLKVVKLSGYVMEHFQMDHYGCASIYLNKDILTEYDVLPRQAAALVSVLGQVKGIQAWVMLVDEGDVIRARLRSKGPIINELAKAYNGGGHPFASGATLHNREEINGMLTQLSALCKTTRRQLF